MTEGPTRKGALLDLILTSQEGLTGNVKIEGSLGCSHHEMVEFRNVRAGRRVTSKLTTQDFWRADSGLVKGLLGRVPWDKALAGSGGPRKLLHIQGSHLPSSREVRPNEQQVRPKCQEACVDEEGAPEQTQTKRKPTEGGSKDG